MRGEEGREEERKRGKRKIRSKNKIKITCNPSLRSNH
jgi:hypothetical protein